MQRPKDTSLKDSQINTLIGLYSQGRLQEALTKGIELASTFPDNPLIPHALGAIYMDLGRSEEAIASFHRALRLKPDYADVYMRLGMALNGAGKQDDAITSFRKAIEIQPGNSVMHNNLGIALNSIGMHEDAIASYRRALNLKPDYASAHENLAISLCRIGRHEDAVASFHRALEVNPDKPALHYNLGIALSGLGRHEEAVNSFRRAFDLDRTLISVRGNLLHELTLICDWDQIGDSMVDDVRSIEFGVNPNDVISPFILLNVIDDPQQHRRASEAYSLCYFKPNATLGPVAIRDKRDRIRVGYFSSDFHNHATMYLMAELFERHDRSKFEIHAFSYGPDKMDEMRSRLTDAVEAFHDIRLKGDAEIGALSRSLGIDVAVDLKGYTGENRARIFSYRVAPIQVNYLGYPGTLGAPFIDYIIADSTLIPATHREFYSEKVAYLPDSYQVNDSTRIISDKALTRGDFGLPDEAVVFCCFNNSFKITSDVFDIWMRLLSEVKGSVLWLLAANKSAKLNLRNEASKRGINSNRLIFAERVSPAEHLARNRLADLFLDTFNYNAHTTASDALWAGLPVLTKMGESFASRVGGSLLAAVDIPELITTTSREYEATAMQLATHPQELRAIKEKLARNLKSTALFDTARFAIKIEAAFTHMVKRLDLGLKPDHFHVEI